jgi:uncharacterized protein (DUF486 family)
MPDDYSCMLISSKCFSVTFLKIYQELIGCVAFKIFASFGLCDHVHSFMAIVHLVCVLASHE